ncbi:MAG: phosphoribosyl-AMP cyclohydrolase [Candidatus Firestonebacteria bacterium]
MLDKVCKLKFNSAGLIPAIVQDYKTGEVLMLAYMNDKSFKLTLKTKKVHFYSRSRQKLWCKGESSGNIQRLRGIYLDCDLDTVLVKVEQVGGAACHTGHRSCFYSKYYNGKIKICGKPVFDPKKVYKK